MAIRLNEKGDNYLSLHAATKALGLSRHTVLLLGASGRLRVRVVAGRTVVERRSVERLRAERAAEMNAAEGGGSDERSAPAAGGSRHVQ